jgi:hypothetical protein
MSSHGVAVPVQCAACAGSSATGVAVAAADGDLKGISLELDWLLTAGSPSAGTASGKTAAALTHLQHMEIDPFRTPTVSLLASCQSPQGVHACPGQDMLFSPHANAGDLQPE